MTNPILIEGPNLSLAWAKAFATLDGLPGKEAVGLTVSFSGFEDGEPVEDQAIRIALDTAIDATCPENAVKTVANTIFPRTIWRIAHGDRQEFYRHYLENLPTYVAWDRRNRKGTYFSRLIAFDVDPRTGTVPGHTDQAPLNQLEVVISHCEPGRRRSYLQASIFDPARDHSEAAQLGFPCLQHLAFVPDFRTGTLTLNAFYATQQLFAKAYGDFLGLARLGLFVAGETDLTLDRVSCFVGVEKMDVRPLRAGITPLRMAISTALAA